METKRGNPNWGDGKSGNPNGRPKKENCLTDILKATTDKMVTNVNGEKVAVKQAIADKLIQLALDGDTVALKYLYDRVDGRSRETIDINDSREDKLDIVLERIAGKSKDE